MQWEMSGNSRDRIGRRFKGACDCTRPTDNNTHLCNRASSSLSFCCCDFHFFFLAGGGNGSDALPLVVSAAAAASEVCNSVYRQSGERQPSFSSNYSQGQLTSQPTISSGGLNALKLPPSSSPPPTLTRLQRDPKRTHTRLTPLALTAVPLRSNVCNPTCAPSSGPSSPAPNGATATATVHENNTLSASSSRLGLSASRRCCK